MQYNDIVLAHALKEELDRLRPARIADNVVAALVYTSGASGIELAKEWFEDEGATRIVKVIRAWVKDKRDATKAQLSALDAQIASDIAEGDADTTP